MNGNGFFLLLFVCFANTPYENQRITYGDGVGGLTYIGGGGGSLKRTQWTHSDSLFRTDPGMKKIKILLIILKTQTTKTVW